MDYGSQLTAMFTYMVSDCNGLAQSTATITYMVSDGNELAQSTDSNVNISSQ